MKEMKCNLVIQASDITVSINSGNVPVIAPSSDDLRSSDIAMAVNFLRSGSESVQLIVDDNPDNRVGGYERWMEDKESLLRKISLPGEKLVLNRIHGKDERFTVFTLSSKKIGTFPP